MGEDNVEGLASNRIEVVKSLKRWITQTAREFRCNDDDVIYLTHDIIDAWYSQGNLC